MLAAAQVTTCNCVQNEVIDLGQRIRGKLVRTKRFPTYDRCLELFSDKLFLVLRIAILWCKEAACNERHERPPRC